MRIAMGVEYDGTPFRGWQSQQKGVATVQGRLEQALSFVADQAVSIYCAGRTDAGVHALGQVIHFDTDAVRTERNWLLGTNVNLPETICVNWATPVDGDFHARFSALSRSYRYTILNRRTRSALRHDRVVWLHTPLDETRMQEAAEHLLGTHDFSAYRAAGCQAKNPVRTVTRLRVSRQGDLVHIEVTANAFLHHMVRNVAGVLIAIGTGERPVEWSREVLELRDRTLGGVTAPPQGLYLTAVEYSAEFNLPANPLPG